ncbi:DUF262 domain-containing protein [Leucobacter salsicius]|uniref:DUF262 domain-containing protein n=1 Tax=Leucobacter salsicius TaxID=664638 RepID=UPI0003477E01|nr:DUF262 domain-containing protein [Leucobacter salsicius]
MTHGGVQATAQTVRQLLTASHYEVPVYQRNYAWGEEEIRQLIDDLIDAATDDEISEYFLGNIVVSTVAHNGSSKYFLIDGQQRLTTLHILFTYLIAKGTHPDLQINRLLFESRPRAEEALATLANGGSAEVGDPGILNGYRIIEQYPESTTLLNHLDFILDNVLVARLELPESTDLNRYFEVINTRGEQLQQQDIVKARMMAALGSDTKRTTFAWVWDACALMDTYVQIALAPGNTSLRAELFGENWHTLNVKSFESLTPFCPSLSDVIESGPTTPTLDDAILGYANADQIDPDDRTEGERFSSIIQFPVFLLHVLRVVEGKAVDETETALDDKRLIKRFTDYLRSGDPATRTEEFALALLRCRLLFDSLILKREFTMASGDDGIWSLKRVVKGENRSRRTITHVPRYIGSFPFDSDGGAEGEATDDSAISKRIRLIEAALRVTYTSPRTMHWITQLLDFAYHAEILGNLRADDVLQLLEQYALSKLAPHFRDAQLLSTGFDIPRIAFTYLDYLLACRSGDLDFQFTFRNSVEHFYPQSPDAEIIRAYGVLEVPASRDLFGNLALLTVRDNSKFTNLPPYVKSDSARIVEQSPKLVLMAKTAKRSPRSWDSDAIHAHHREMVSLLWNEIHQHQTQEGEGLHLFG